MSEIEPSPPALEARSARLLVCRFERTSKEPRVIKLPNGREMEACCMLRDDQNLREIDYRYMARLRVGALHTFLK
jgi:hypothetical protein